jgi:hypothetical protein
MTPELTGCPPPVKLRGFVNQPHKEQAMKPSDVYALVPVAA